MAARPAGGGVTPERVVKLLREEVAKTSQAATARATGLTLRGVQNYLKGIGEPTTATLQKLADYFEVSVAWLRGEGSEYRTPLIEVITRRMMQRSSAKTLADYVDYAKTVYGICTTEARVQELLPEAEQELLRTKAQDAELDIAMNTLLHCFEEKLSIYDDFSFPALERLLEIIWESDVIRFLVEALIQIPEGKRREAVTILQREGIIPATKDASSSCSVFDIALQREGIIPPTADPVK